MKILENGAILFTVKEQGEVAQALISRAETLRATISMVKIEAEERPDKDEYLAVHERIFASFEESAKLCEKMADGFE